MLDIFDFHLEVCAQRTETNDLYQQEANDAYYFSLLQNNGQEEQAPNQENWNEQNQEEWNGQENHEGQEGQEGQEEQEGEHDSEEEDDIDLDSLTYEQLMTLDNTIVKKGMTDKEMEQFPIDVFIKGYDQEGSCSVCISDLESGEITRKLTCAHKFHKDCIDTWLKHNITCPDCKKYLR